MQSFLAIICCSIVLMSTALFSDPARGTDMGAADYLAIFLTAEVVIKGPTGDDRDWQAHTQDFIGAIRKRFMNWRMSRPSDKQKYHSSPLNEQEMILE